MNKFGPTFIDELAAAGLMGLPFTWGDDGGLSFAPDMPQAQIDAVNAVVATHNPSDTKHRTDFSGFMGDVMVLFPRRKLRKIISAATLSAFLRQDVAAIKMDIDEMFSDAEITQAERNTLYTKAVLRGLPGF